MFGAQLYFPRINTHFKLWDFKFSWRRVWSSDLSSGMYCRVKSPWWWRQHVPLKRLPTIILHGSTSQKTNLKIILAYFRIRRILGNLLHRGLSLILTWKKYNIYTLNFPAAVITDLIFCRQFIMPHKTYLFD